MPWDDPQRLYRRGDYWQTDDRSGFRVRSSKTVTDWDNRVVAEKHSDGRHPQDFVRGRRDRSGPPNPFPEPSDVFLTDNQVSRDDL